MKIVAVNRLTYASRTYQPGEEFEAEDIHAKLLIQYGNVRDANKLQTAALKPAESVEPVSHNTRGKYRRRDMRAED